MLAESFRRSTPALRCRLQQAHETAPNEPLSWPLCDLEQVADDGIGLIEPHPWRRDDSQMTRIWPEGRAKREPVGRRCHPRK
jgi:hypothetical protein